MHGHHAYECPNCGGWHLTKVPQAPSAEKREGAIGVCAVCDCVVYQDGSEVHAGYCVELAALRRRVEALEAKAG